MLLFTGNYLCKKKKKTLSRKIPKARDEHSPFPNWRMGNSCNEKERDTQLLGTAAEKLFLTWGFKNVWHLEADFSNFETKEILATEM